MVKTHILRTGERKHLHRERRHKIWREMYEVYFASLGHAFKGPEIRRDYDYDEVCFIRNFNSASFEKMVRTDRRKTKRYSLCAADCPAVAEKQAGRV